MDVKKSRKGKRVVMRNKGGGGTLEKKANSQFIRVVQGLGDRIENSHNVQS